MNHQITISVQKRNDLVTEYLWCIDFVMERNRLLMKIAHLDPEDVYQDLALRLVETIGTGRRERETLQRYVTEQLERELIRCVRVNNSIRNNSYELYGLSAHYDIERQGEPCLAIQIIA